MADVFYFICVKTTYPVVVPDRDDGRGLFQRRVKGGFAAIADGALRAGNLLARPNQNAVPNHLFADGSEYPISDFPQLFAEIGIEFGGDGVTTFAVPDYSDAPVTAGEITVTQTVEGSTVSTGEPVVVPTEPGQAGGSEGGNVVVGGRNRRLGENEQEQ